MTSTEADTSAAHRVATVSGGARWLLHHRLAASGTLRRSRRNALASLLVALTLGVALALPALVWLGVTRLESLALTWDAEPRINVFVTTERSPEVVEDLLDEFRASTEVAEVAWQSPEQSLAEFVAAVGFDDSLAAGIEALGGSPLPGVAVVTPAAEVQAPARLRALAARLERTPGVQGVQIDLDWVLRLRAALALATRLTVGLGLLLGAGVLLAVAGLTRGALEERRSEILVLRLVGGSDAFIRRPFLYAGALQGASGGVVAFLLVLALLLAASGPAQELADSYGLVANLDLPIAALGLVLVGAGALLGWIGARWALALRLASIEP